MKPSLEMTRDGMVSALTPRPGLLPQTKPELLRDVLRMKRARGDADADQFKIVACQEFAYKLNGSIRGAANAMRQWLAKADKLGWTAERVASRQAFLADLDRVLAGDLTGWDPSMARAA